MTAPSISAELSDARLAATIAHLDSGPGPARIRVYDGVRPAPGDPGTTLLVEIALNKPCGVLAAHIVTLASTDLPICLNSGTATWARIVNGSGAYAIDCDVSDASGTAPIKLSAVLLLAGAKVALVSGVFR